MPPVLWGGAHSLAREGLGESQFREGTYIVVLFIYTYFGFSLSTCVASEVQWYCKFDVKNRETLKAYHFDWPALIEMLVFYQSFLVSPQRARRELRIDFLKVKMK